MTCGSFKGAIAFLCVHVLFALLFPQMKISKPGLNEVIAILWLISETCGCENSMSMIPVDSRCVIYF